MYWAESYYQKWFYKGYAKMHHNRFLIYISIITSPMSCCMGHLAQPCAHPSIHLSCSEVCPQHSHSRMATRLCFGCFLSPQPGKLYFCTGVFLHLTSLLPASLTLSEVGPSCPPW